MLLPVGLIAAAPADAVGGTVCKTASGTATFLPALPSIKSTTKNKPTVTIKNGKLAGCVGGGVTSATLTATLKFGLASNCKSLLAGASTNTKGTEKITWNNKKTSTVTLTLTGVPKKPTNITATGPVTLGLFKGSKQSGTLAFTLPAGACTTKPLSTVTFKVLPTSKITIK
jgi:hypothetical protein